MVAGFLQWADQKVSVEVSFAGHFTCCSFPMKAHYGYDARKSKNLKAKLHAGRGGLGQIFAWFTWCYSCRFSYLDGYLRWALGRHFNRCGFNVSKLSDDHCIFLVEFSLVDLAHSPVFVAFAFLPLDLSLPSCRTDCFMNTET